MSNIIPDWVRDVLTRTRRTTAVDSISVGGHGELIAYDVAELRAEYPDWDSFGQERKLLLQQEFEPIARHRNHNIAIQAHLEYLVDELDPGQSVDLDASHVAIGNGTDQPEFGDSGLSSETDRFAVGTHTDDTINLQTSTVLSSSQANGTNISEVGLVSASSGGTFFNRALVGPEEKNSSKEITVNVDLEYEVA